MGWVDAARNFVVRQQVKKQLRAMVAQLASEPGRGIELEVNWAQPTPQDITLLHALEEIVTESQGNLAVERWRGKLTLTYRQAALDAVLDDTGKQMEKNAFLSRPNQRLTPIDPHDVSGRHVPLPPKEPSPSE